MWVDFSSLLAIAEFLNRNVWEAQPTQDIVLFLNFRHLNLCVWTCMCGTFSKTLSLLIYLKQKCKFYYVKHTHTYTFMCIYTCVWVCVYYIIQDSFFPFLTPGCSNYSHTLPYPALLLMYWVQEDFLFTVTTRNLWFLVMSSFLVWLKTDINLLKLVNVCLFIIHNCMVTGDRQTKFTKILLMK